jgi:hypothetical protein
MWLPIAILVHERQRGAAREVNRTDRLTRW